MFDITISFDELNRLEEAMLQLQERMDAVLSEAMTEAEDVVFLEMNTHPPSIPFPPTNVHWDSPAQRRRYHNSAGFGNGDPYRRSGNLASALEETPPTVQPGLVHGSVMAIEDWVKYVLGEKGVQSRIHAERAEPWRSVSVIKDKVRPKVLEVFQSAVTRVVESFKI